MILAEKWRPQRLIDVVGQPVVNDYLLPFSRRPDSRCLMFCGDSGNGKTSAANALAADMGIDDFYGVHTLRATELTADISRDLMRKLALRPMVGRWNMLVIEELEYLHPQVENTLKVDLEQRLPRHTVVVATSNKPAKLGKALRDRFKVLRFASGNDFATACQERIKLVWSVEACGQTPPAQWQQWGWDEDVKDSFSLRLAYDHMETELVKRGLV